jgi:hypothetical protein
MKRPWGPVLNRDSVGTVDAQARTRPAWFTPGSMSRIPGAEIAKRRFEAAKAEFGGEISMEYHSIELAPDLPTDYLSSEAASSGSPIRARPAVMSNR